VLYLEGGAGAKSLGPNELLFAELFARHIAPLADRLLALFHLNELIRVYGLTRSARK